MKKHVVLLLLPPLKNEGVLPVAVLTTDNFDAKTVDPSTVTFAGASPVQWTFEDVHGDGAVDLVLQFNTKDLDWTRTEATLTGTTYGGIPIFSDAVKIVLK